MKVHVIYAHPLKESLAARLHEAVLEGLSQAGHEIDDLDLYAEGFDPVMSEADRRDYHDVAINQTRVTPYIERLQSADALVLCHPVWNFGWPAILKGYLDRVFLPDVSFTIEGGKVGPGLTNIRKLATVTTYGSTRWRAMVLGDPPRKNGTRFLRVICHPKVSVSYHALYGINDLPAGAVDAFSAKVRTAMARF